ncbi:MAG: two-CW domain-containing protein [Bryobacteraceae bacterium]
MAEKKNCWQVKNCGRQLGGLKTRELGVCRASTAASAGFNGGANGGRICWAFAGTLCGGKVQGTFAQKAANCMECPFYVTVRTEEGSNFKLLI